MFFLNSAILLALIGLAFFGIRYVILALSGKDTNRYSRSDTSFLFMLLVGILLVCLPIKISMEDTFAKNQDRKDWFVEKYSPKELVDFPGWGQKQVKWIDKNENLCQGDIIKSDNTYNLYMMTCIAPALVIERGDK